MATAVIIVTLLTVAASLASWLFGQWLARRTRISGAALAVGGGGAVFLIASVAFVIVTASTWWPKLVPVDDSSTPTSTRSTDRWPVKTQPATALAQKAQWLAAAERHLQRNEYSQAVDVAREYLVAVPGDNDMRSMLARALFAAEHPGPASIMPAAVVAQWPATDCVESLRGADSSRWILDNGCGRVVAVLFASCQSSEIACFSNAVVSQSWSYERSGILLTAANDRPVPVRLGDDGPLVAPIFTIRDVAGVRRQIRYLACEVTAPRVLQLLHDSGEQLTSQRLQAELRADSCYARVLDWSRNGHRLGASPDALLRQGIN